MYNHHQKSALSAFQLEPYNRTSIFTKKMESFHLHVEHSNSYLKGFEFLKLIFDISLGLFRGFRFPRARFLGVERMGKSVQQHHIFLFGKPVRLLDTLEIVF